jgi:hypothetical protein
MKAVYEDSWFTFRFADDRIIPRFHLEGASAGRLVSIFKIDSGTGDRLGLLATATVGEGGWVDLSPPIIVRAGDAFVAVPRTRSEKNAIRKMGILAERFFGRRHGRAAVFRGSILRRLPARDQSPGILLRLRRLVLGVAGHVHRDRLRPCSISHGDAAGRAGESEFCRGNSRAVCVRASAGRVDQVRGDGRDVDGFVCRRVFVDAKGVGGERVAD